MGLWALPAKSQNDSSSNWVLHLGGHYYRGDKQSAQFFRGETFGTLDQSLNQPNNRNRIEDLLGGYTFRRLDYADMAYNAALAFSLQLDYRIHARWKLWLEMSQVNLEATGFFRLQVDRINQDQNLEPYRQKVAISGREQRAHFGLGLGYDFWRQNGWYASAEGGLGLVGMEGSRWQYTLEETSFPLALNTGPDNDQGNYALAFNTRGALIWGYRNPQGYGLALKLGFWQGLLGLGETSGTWNWTAGINLHKAW